MKEWCPPGDVQSDIDVDRGFLRGELWNETFYFLHIIQLCKCLKSGIQVANLGYFTGPTNPPPPPPPPPELHELNDRVPETGMQAVINLSVETIKARKDMPPQTGVLYFITTTIL